MKRTKKTAAAFGVIIVIALWLVRTQNAPQTIARSCNSIAITLPDNYIISAEVAKTTAQRMAGLSNRTSLARTSGMLFVFPTRGLHSFWMKDTKIPLDIIWIDGQTVVDRVTLEAESDAIIPQYTPKKPADFVLELNKGSADTHGIYVGTDVSWKTCS